MMACSHEFSQVTHSVSLGERSPRKKIYLVLIICLVLLVSTWFTNSKLVHDVRDSYHFVPWITRFSPDRNASLGNSRLAQVTITDINDEYSTRLIRVKEYCKAKQRGNKACQNGAGDCIPRALIVDENQKVMFCAIPKVASTIWKTKLILMTGKPHPTKIRVHGNKGIAKYNIFHIKNFTQPERAYRMKNYFKFVFVRHPLTRLLSAYREKIEFGTHSYGKRMLPSIMKYLRHNKTNSRSISFEEFASYITRGEGPMAKNRHWAPYNKLCRFCDIQYDFIGRQESMEVEGRYLIQTQFHKPHDVGFNNTIHRTYSGLELARKYYAQVSEETKQSLLRLYGEDMDMFGYSSRDIF